MELGIGRLVLFAKIIYFHLRNFICALKNAGYLVAEAYFTSGYQIYKYYISGKRNIRFINRRNFLYYKFKTRFGMGGCYNVFFWRKFWCFPNGRLRSLRIVLLLAVLVAVAVIELAVVLRLQVVHHLRPLVRVRLRLFPIRLDR